MKKKLTCLRDIPGILKEESKLKGLGAEVVKDKILQLTKESLEHGHSA